MVEMANEARTNRQHFPFIMPHTHTHEFRFWKFTKNTAVELKICIEYNTNTNTYAHMDGVYTYHGLSFMYRILVLNIEVASTCSHFMTSYRIIIIDYYYFRLKISDNHSCINQTRDIEREREMENHLKYIL